jgi:hypothetical protein
VESTNHPEENPHDSLVSEVWFRIELKIRTKADGLCLFHLAPKTLVSILALASLPGEKLSTVSTDSQNYFMSLPQQFPLGH